MDARRIIRKEGPYIVLIFDAIALIIALIGALVVRNPDEFSATVLSLHLIPFSVIIAVSGVIFFIAGLYDRYVIPSIKALIPKVVNAQLVVTVLAALYFYIRPDLGITPKITLTLYSVFAVCGIFLVRVMYRTFSQRDGVHALLVGSGSECAHLYSAVLHTRQLGLSFVQHIDPDSTPDVYSAIMKAIAVHHVSYIVIDENNPKIEAVIPKLYSLVFERVSFVDVRTLYEELFEKIPLGLVRHEWFLENIVHTRRVAYDSIKRIIDIVLAIFLGIPSLLIFPFVYLAIKLEDGQDVFITQTRIGRYGARIALRKYRSMTVNDGGKWLESDDRRLTKVGKFIRKTRIDELPQLMAVLRGDLSLIGPRPDIENLGEQIETQLPFYSIRYLIKPGLSGWAQVKQDLPPQSLEETRERLAYDLYYVKNRSLMLDLVIALRTIKTLLSRKGM